MVIELDPHPDEGLGVAGGLLFGRTIGSVPILLAPGWALEAFGGKVSAKILKSLRF